MAALSADRAVPNVLHTAGGVSGGYIIDYSCAGADIIYKGAFVQIDAGGDIVPVTDIGGACLGIAMEQKDGTGESDGYDTCPVLVGAAIIHNVASTTIANIGDACWASDDQTLDLSAASSDAPFGWILNFISGDSCIVQHAWPGLNVTLV